MPKRFLAWCVHAYTALGLVAAAGIAAAILNRQFALAFLLMLVATLIDATDGVMARWVKVKEVLPGFDGRKLDDLIDFQTFTTLPLLLVWQARLLPEGLELILLAPLLASAYGFCQVSAKTPEGYFLGFPSYWNIVAFYLYATQPAAPIAIGLLLFFAFMTFVPILYLYPTQHGRLNRLTNLLAVPWTILLVWIVVRMWLAEDEARAAGLDAAPDATTELLAGISLAFPVYYLLTSWLVTVTIIKRERALEKRLTTEARDEQP